ncbi:ATP-binding protein [soil metagenome]
MELQEVESMIARGPESEWVDLELKKSLAEKEAAMRTLCGFLNLQGGTVIFGVSPQGRIVGTELTDGNVRNLGDLFRFIEPAVPVEQQRILLDNGKGLLLLTVQPVPEEGPYTYHGRPYLRTGSRTDPMPQNVYEQRLANRGSPKTRWENQPAPDVSLTEIDEHEIRRTARLGVAAGRIPEEEVTEKVTELLRKFRLMRGDTLLNAAVALFGRPSAGDYPQLRLHLAHFNGTNKDADMLDHRPAMEGHAFELFREAEQFLLRRLPQSGRVLPGVFERVDEPLFPINALREVLANAFAHRDYAHASGSVHVAIYTDRVEVTNPGTLPPGLTLDDLIGFHDSKPRNPLIARVFYMRRLIDEWGRGTRLIVRLCRDAGHPDPEFFLQAGSFGVRLFSAVPLGPAPTKQPELKPGEVALLQALHRGDAAVRDLIAAVGAGTPVPTVRTYLSNLQDLGLVESTGRGRGAQWHIRSGGIQVLGTIEGQPSR